MKMQTPKAMAKPFDINSMSKIVDCNKQRWFTNSKVKWVLKLVEIDIILMFRFVKDEYTFSTFAFLKENYEIG
jgi:hypothetical protein